MQERLILLLEAIAGANAPVTVAELTRVTGFPKASIYRNIGSLVDCGFVEETEDGSRYVLGMRFVKIALTGKSDAHVIKAVSPLMYRVAKDTAETSFLARFRGGRVDLVHVEMPTDPTVSFIYPGLGARPAHACSSAKAIAAFILPELREQLLDAQMDRFTGRTITTRSDFDLELNRVRRDGYALCDGEIDEGVTSVAVPIGIERLGAVFSIGVVGPQARILPNLQDRILPVLNAEAIRAAAAIQHCSVTEAETTNRGALSDVKPKDEHMPH
ncbi:IclR family transcriptional regulator [Rhodobacteraceae bacterium F11138]|nr:IclR family transcriptional regulator [Rhodobacteraceae bacterium F11138]